jgi:protein-L-isoaspartate O-methyltransferase
MSRLFARRLRTLEIGAGDDGYPDGAPYDRLIVTRGITGDPEIGDQLAALVQQ